MLPDSEQRLPGSFRRYAGFARSVLAVNLGRLELPYRLFLHTTDACNCRCTMCNIWKKPTDGELTLEELTRILDHAAPHIRWLDIAGGEIVLRPDVEPLFQAIVDRLPRLLMVHFATNGLLTERIVACARILRRSAIPQQIVTVSLDGPPALHEQIRGVPGIFARCLETFQALRRLGMPVVFGMTLTEQNVDAYPATFAAVRAHVPEISHHDFHVNLGQVSDLYYDNRGLVNPPLPRLLKAVEEIARLRGWRLHPVSLLEAAFLQQARRFVQTGRTPLPCEALRSSCVLGTRGDLYPCIIYNRSLGNVRQHRYSIATLWQTEARRGLRKEIREGQCPHCWTPCEAYQTLLGNLRPGGSPP